MYLLWFCSKDEFQSILYHSSPKCPTGLGKLFLTGMKTKENLPAFSWGAGDLSQNFLLAKADLSIYIKMTVFFLLLVPFWFTFFLIDSLLPGVLKITPQILEWLRVLFGSSSGHASSWPHSVKSQLFHPHDCPEERGSFWGGSFGPILSACEGSKDMFIAQSPVWHLSALNILKQYYFC